MWFEELTGFTEEDPEQVREKLFCDGRKIVSRVNGRTFFCGDLTTPSLAKLRHEAASIDIGSEQIQISETVADVQRLHVDPVNSGALFQVASQFNLLEMISPGVTPECGVGIYEDDRTQGPACAIATGAGTIFRNYFMKLNGQIGQTAENQIDCLRAIGQSLGNNDNKLWTMRNGYALPSEDGLRKINHKLEILNEQDRDHLRSRLHIGIQQDTQVTLSESTHLVTQAYCSALPVAYSMLSESLWKSFAILILEAAYEATFCAAKINTQRTGNPNVYLTLLGGGAFGNQPSWIFAAIKRAILKFRNQPLNVRLVSYGRSNPQVIEFFQRL